MPCGMAICPGRATVADGKQKVCFLARPCGAPGAASVKMLQQLNGSSPFFMGKK